MTASPEAVLISKILKRHGARPDLRLWRNETALAWVGKWKGNTSEGDTVLRKGARRILAGLCKGSADLIGIGKRGQFIAIEVKTGRKRATKRQESFLDVVKQLGGIGAVVRSVEEADEILGPPPPKKKATEGPSQRSLWLETYIAKALDRGDLRQAIAYTLETVRRLVPEDVDEEDWQYAKKKGVGWQRWWQHYKERRTGE